MINSDVISDTLVAHGNLDIEGFTDELSTLLKKAWGDDWGTFQLEEPTGDEPEETKLPIITYDYNSRRRSKTHSSLDPVLFDSFTDKENSQIVKVHRQWFDVTMSFKIFHETNREAMELMADLEAFLFTYKGHLKKLGVSELIFEEEKKPDVKTKWNKPVVQRELVYLIRIERIYEQRLNIAERIELKDTDTKTGNPMFGNSAILQHYEKTKLIISNDEK